MASSATSNTDLINTDSSDPSSSSPPPDEAPSVNKTSDWKGKGRDADASDLEHPDVADDKRSVNDELAPSDHPPHVIESTEEPGEHSTDTPNAQKVQGSTEQKKRDDQLSTDYTTSQSHIIDSLNGDESSQAARIEPHHNAEARAQSAGSIQRRPYSRDSGGSGHPETRRTSVTSGRRPSSSRVPLDDSRQVITESLEDEASGRGRGPARGIREIVLPRWQPDAEVTFCPICRTQFSFFVRKHHCRSVFCPRSSKAALIPYINFTYRLESVQIFSLI
jgi:hypothetical protein